jgi:hypothetical protein
MDPGIIADYDAEGYLAGVDVLSVSKRQRNSNATATSL